jgi:hypothetical protein
MDPEFVAYLEGKGFSEADYRSWDLQRKEEWVDRYRGKILFCFILFLIYFYSLLSWSSLFPFHLWNICFFNTLLRDSIPTWAQKYIYLYTSACAIVLTYLGYIIAVVWSIIRIFAGERNTTTLLANILFWLGSTAVMFFFLSFDSFRKSLAKYIFRGEKAEIMYRSLCDPPDFIADEW